MILQYRASVGEQVKKQLVHHHFAAALPDER